MNTAQETTLQPVDITMFDIVTPANAGCEVEILTPAGEKSGVIFHVLGRDSDAYQNILAQHSRDRMAKMAKAGRSFVPTDTDFENEAVSLLVAVTKSWSNLSLPFSQENADKIYRDKKFVLIREQVEAAVHDRQRFTKP